MVFAEVRLLVGLMKMQAILQEKGFISNNKLIILAKKKYSPLELNQYLKPGVV